MITYVGAFRAAALCISRATACLHVAGRPHRDGAMAAGHCGHAQDDPWALLASQLQELCRQYAEEQNKLIASLRPSATLWPPHADSLDAPPAGSAVEASSQEAPPRPQTRLALEPRQAAAIPDPAALVATASGPEESSFSGGQNGLQRLGRCRQGSPGAKWNGQFDGPGLDNTGECQSEPPSNPGLDKL
eukprot:s6795_g1.t2